LKLISSTKVAKLTHTDLVQYANYFMPSRRLGLAVFDIGPGILLF
jgi:hypothetical protein